MIAAVIRWSIAQRLFVLLAAAMVVAAGVIAVRSTAIDALPDLSDVQVIIRTNYPGQAPRIVENQVTYPLATTMLSVPGARVVRGYSFVGYSLVYVLFEDGTDLYWARSRVLEYLSQVQSRLPEGARASLGPDATKCGREREQLKSIEQKLRAAGRAGMTRKLMQEVQKLQGKMASYQSRCAVG